MHIYMYMYIFMYAYIYIFMYMYIYCKCICISVSICICNCKCMSICLYMYIYVYMYVMYVYMFLFMCMCMSVYVYVYVYVYVFVYVYVCVYVYVYVNVYVWLSDEFLWNPSSLVSRIRVFVDSTTFCVYHMFFDDFFWLIKSKFLLMLSPLFSHPLRPAQWLWRSWLREGMPGYKVVPHSLLRCFKTKFTRIYGYIYT